MTRLIQLNVENPGQLKQLQVHSVLLLHMHCIEQTNDLCGLTSDFTHALLPAGWGSGGLLDDTQCIYLHIDRTLHIHYKNLHSLSRSFAYSATILGMAWDAYQSKMTQSNQLATQHKLAWKWMQHMCSEMPADLGLKYCSVQMQTDQSKDKKAKAKSL